MDSIQFQSKFGIWMAIFLVILGTGISAHQHQPRQFNSPRQDFYNGFNPFPHQTHSQRPGPGKRDAHSRQQNFPQQQGYFNNPFLNGNFPQNLGSFQNQNPFQNNFNQGQFGQNSGFPNYNGNPFQQFQQNQPQKHGGGGHSQPNAPVQNFNQGNFPNSFNNFPNQWPYQANNFPNGFQGGNQRPNPNIPNPNNGQFPNNQNPYGQTPNPRIQSPNNPNPQYQIPNNQKPEDHVRNPEGNSHINPKAPFNPQYNNNGKDQGGTPANPDSGNFPNPQGQNPPQQQPQNANGNRHPSGINDPEQNSNPNPQNQGSQTDPQLDVRQGHENIDESNNTPSNHDQSEKTNVNPEKQQKPPAWSYYDENDPNAKESDAELVQLTKQVSQL